MKLSSKKLELELKTMAQVACMDIIQYQDDRWSTYFLTHNASMTCPDDVILFYNLRDEYLKLIPTGIDPNNVKVSSYWLDILPRLMAYSNKITEVTSIIIDKCKLNESMLSR